MKDSTNFSSVNLRITKFTLPCKLGLYIKSNREEANTWHKYNWGQVEVLSKLVRRYGFKPDLRWICVKTVLCALSSQVLQAYEEELLLSADCSLNPMKLRWNRWKMKPMYRESQLPDPSIVFKLLISQLTYWNCIPAVLSFTILWCISICIHKHSISNGKKSLDFVLNK